MLFCRNAQSLSNSGLRLSGPSGSEWAREAKDVLRSAWKSKFFLIGIGLIGLSYFVLHISGVYEQSLTLTVFTLLTLLFFYILWCNHQKQHHLNQNVSATDRTRSTVATISELVSSSHPRPPLPLLTDKRDTPPPSYQEAMLATAAVTVPVRNPMPPPQIHPQLPSPPPPTPHFGIDMVTV